jgi:hypothetical protein
VTEKLEATAPIVLEKKQERRDVFKGKLYIDARK